MKKAFLLIIYMILLPGLVHSAIIIKKIEKLHEDDSPREVVYYLKDEEVARESYDEDGNMSRMGIMPDGTVKEYYESGPLKARIRYKNGKKNGTTTEYHENGKKKANIKYVDEIKTGITKRYDENGKLEYKITYLDDMKTGPAIKYNITGKPKYKWNYKEDVLEGVSFRYFSNGKVRWEEGYKNGRKVYRKKFSKKGRFISRKEYPEEDATGGE